MSKRKQPQRSEVKAQENVHKPHRETPVEKAWLKFVDAFLALQKTPNDEGDKEIHQAWEKALRAADGAAYTVTAQRATCLRDMELKIQAWAFTSGVKVGSDVASLAKWTPHRYAESSNFVASLRDDVLAMKRLAWGASIAVGSIASGQPPFRDMPVAMPYPN
jgi:hypothetical protein